MAFKESYKLLFQPIRALNYMKNSNLQLSEWIMAKELLSSFICLIALLIWFIGDFSWSINTVIIGHIVLGIISFLSMIGSGLVRGGQGIIVAFIGNLWFPSLFAFLFFGVDLSLYTEKWILGIFITWKIMGLFGKPNLKN